MLDRKLALLRLEGAIQDLRELIDDVERKAPSAHTDDLWLVAAKIQQTYGYFNRVASYLPDFDAWMPAVEDTK